MGVLEYFYRAISKRTYKEYEKQSYIPTGEFWTEPISSKGQIHTPRSWKETIDKGYGGSGPYDVMIRVKSLRPLEFKVAKIFKGTEAEQIIEPGIFENTGPIEFERAEVVYDPRKAVSEKPIIILEKILGEMGI